MRSSKSRSRNKSNRQRSLGNVLNRVFDSSGPEGKVRGTPQQIIDKYLTLARDAQLSNDRVAEQSFLQHAEHYTRLLGEAQREMAERQQQQQHQSQHNNRQNGEDDRDNGGRDNAQRDHGRDNDSRRDNDPRRESDQREESHNNGASVQADVNPAASETLSSDAGAGATPEPQKPQAETGNGKSESSSRRASKPRSTSSETASRRRKPASEPRVSEQVEQSSLGLPDVVGSTDDGGLVETPETGSTKKTRAKSSTTRTRSPRTTTRKKTTASAKDAAEAPEVPAAETNGNEGGES